jgi:hypothetical protein
VKLEDGGNLLGRFHTSSMETSANEVQVAGANAEQMASIDLTESDHQDQHEDQDSKTSTNVSDCEEVDSRESGEVAKTEEVSYVESTDMVEGDVMAKLTTDPVVDAGQLDPVALTQDSMTEKEEKEEKETTFVTAELNSASETETKDIVGRSPDTSTEKMGDSIAAVAVEAITTAGKEPDAAVDVVEETATTTVSAAATTSVEEASHTGETDSIQDTTREDKAAIETISKKDPIVAETTTNAPSTKRKKRKKKKGGATTEKASSSDSDTKGIDSLVKIDIIDSVQEKAEEWVEKRESMDAKDGQEESAEDREGVEPFDTDKEEVSIARTKKGINSESESIVEEVLHAAIDNAVDSAIETTDAVAEASEQGIEERSDPTLSSAASRSGDHSHQTISSLMDVLACDAGYESLRTFAELEYSSENVEFWKAATLYRQISGSHIDVLEEKVSPLASIFLF